MAAGALLCALGRIGLVGGLLSSYVLTATPDLSFHVLFLGPLAAGSVAAATAAAVLGAARGRDERRRAIAASLGIAVLAASVTVAFGVIVLHPWFEIHQGIAARPTVDDRVEALGLLGRPLPWLAGSAALLAIGSGLLRLAPWSRWALAAIAAAGVIAGALAEAPALGAPCVLVAGALVLPRASSLFEPALAPRREDLRWYVVTVHAGLVLAVVLGALLPAYRVMAAELGVLLPRATEVVLLLSDRRWCSPVVVLAIAFVPLLLLGPARRAVGFRTAVGLLALATMTLAAAVTLAAAATLVAITLRL